MSTCVSSRYDPLLLERAIDGEKCKIAIVGLSTAAISTVALNVIIQSSCLPVDCLVFPRVREAAVGAGVLSLITARQNFPRVAQLGGLVATSILAKELVFPIVSIEKKIATYCFYNNCYSYFYNNCYDYPNPSHFPRGCYSYFNENCGRYVFSQKDFSIFFPPHITFVGLLSAMGFSFSLAYFVQKNLADYKVTLRSGWEFPAILSGICILSLYSEEFYRNGTGGDNYVPVVILSLSAAQLFRTRFKTTSKDTQLSTTRSKLVLDSKTAIKFARIAGSLISKGIRNGYLNPRSIFVDWAAIVGTGWMVGMRTSPIALVGASVAFGAKVLGKGVVPASVVDKVIDKVVDKVLDRAIPLLEKGMIEAYKKPFSTAADATVVAGAAFAFGATIVPACAVGATVSLGVKAHKGEISLALIARGKSFLKFVASRLCGRRPIDCPAG